MLKPDYRIKKPPTKEEPSHFYNGRLIDKWRTPIGPMTVPHSFTENRVALDKIIKLIVTKK
jgi:hypothetical protein